MKGLIWQHQKAQKFMPPANGKVTISKLSKSAGNFIILNHNNGYTTTFMHLNKRYVKIGEKVKRGQLIGESRKYGLFYWSSSTLRDSKKW